MLAKSFYKAIFRIKRHYGAIGFSALRAIYWRLHGMSVGGAARLSSMEVTWPHKVRLGDRCSLEHGVYFNLAGPYSEGLGIDVGNDCFVGKGCEFNITSGITIGEFCLIGSGSRFIDHDHGMGAGLMKRQGETSGQIILASDVWIGANCTVLQGVSIGQGAVVGAGSVVTRPVEPFTIVAGVPARVIGRRGDTSRRSAENCELREEVLESVADAGYLSRSSSAVESSVFSSRYLTMMGV